MESTTPQMSISDRLSWVNDDDLRQFVCKNNLYYISQWRAFYGPNPPLKVCWNWAAFLMGPFWLGYRKMYIHAVVYIGLLIAVDLLQALVQTDLGAVKYGLLWMLGLIGNNLYYKHALRKMTQMQKDNMDGLESQRRAGGVSWLGVGFVVLLIAGCAVGLAFYEILIDIVMDF